MLLRFADPTRLLFRGSWRSVRFEQWSGEKPESFIWIAIQRCSNPHANLAYVNANVKRKRKVPRRVRYSGQAPMHSQSVKMLPCPTSWEKKGVWKLPHRFHARLFPIVPYLGGKSISNREWKIKVKRGNRNELSGVGDAFTRSRRRGMSLSNWFVSS